MKNVNYLMHIPPGFLNKEVNENTIFTMVNAVKHFQNPRRGDPARKEPDFLLGEYDGLEVTFASSNKTNPGFIQEFCDGLYTQEDAEADYEEFIINALERKALKHYATPKTSLAVLCMVELFAWTESFFSPEEMERIHIRKACILKLIQGKYIATSVFSNVYLLVPSLRREWFIYDVLEGTVSLVDAVDDQVFPYYYAPGSHD